MREGLRYQRKRKLGKTGTSGDEADAADGVSSWEFGDCMSFMIPMSIKYPRKTTVIGLEDVTTNEEQNEIETASIVSQATNSTSVSNYAYADKKKDVVSESVISLSKCLTDYVHHKTQLSHEPQKTLKFNHLWAYLDKLFEKMTPEQVDELNFKFIEMAFEILRKD